MLAIRLQPRASKNELLGQQGGFFKIRLTSPPIENRANAQLITFLAELFAVPASQVTLLSGNAGRNKRVAISKPRTIPPQLIEFAAKNRV